MNFDLYAALQSFSGTLITAALVALGHQWRQTRTRRRFVIEYETVVEDLPILRSEHRCIGAGTGEPSTESTEELEDEIVLESEPKQLEESITLGPAPREPSSQTSSPSRRPASLDFQQVEDQQTQVWLNLRSLVDRGTQTSVTTQSQGVETSLPESVSRYTQVESEPEEEKGTQTPSILPRDQQSQTPVTEQAEEETQTEPVGAVARWRRLVAFERRLAYLLRIRASLTDFLVAHNGIYRRSPSIQDGGEKNQEDK